MNSVNIQEWEAQQTKAFKNWANFWLRQSGYTERKLDNVMTDVADGVILINLFKALSGEEIPRYVKTPALTAQKIENLSIALNAFKEYGIVANVSPEDFLAGKEKFILGYLWRLIQKFQVIHSTRGGGAPSNAKSIRDFVLEWVKEYTEDYPVKVDLNASSPGCFADGWLLCYMIHKTDDSLIDLKEMEKKSRKQRIETAFELAAKIGVPEVIDAGDLLKDNIEEKVLLVYLTSFKTAAENYQKQKPQNQGSSKSAASSKGSSSSSSKPSDASKGSSSSTLANAKPSSSDKSAAGSSHKTDSKAGDVPAGAGNKTASGPGAGTGNKGPGTSNSGSSSGSGSGVSAGNKGPGASGSSSGSSAGNKGPGSSGSASGSNPKGSGSGNSSGSSSGSGGSGIKTSNKPKTTGPGVWDSIATKEQERILCPICEKYLSGRIVCVKTLDNKEYLYHTDCWICSGCRQELLSLGLDFYLLESHPYCAECYHRAIDRVCAKCGKIAKENPVKALGKVWHSTCFVCNKCGCTFSQSRNFYNHNGTPYCEQHFKEVEMSENICARCGKGISGDVLNAIGKKWHDPECWVCKVCSQPLEGKFYNVDGWPRCADCARK